MATTSAYVIRPPKDDDGAGGHGAPGTPDAPGTPGTPGAPGAPPAVTQRAQATPRQSTLASTVHKVKVKGWALLKRPS